MKNSTFVAFGAALLLQACRGPAVVADKKAGELAHAKEAERDKVAAEEQLERMRQRDAERNSTGSQPTNLVNEAIPKH